MRTNPSQTSLDLSGNSVLWELYAYDNALTTLDVSNNPLLTTVVIYGNDLPSGEIDQVIIDLAAHGLSSGTLNYSGNTGPPTSASYDAYQTLFNRGWDITGTIPPTPIPDPPSSSVAGLPIISNFHVKDPTITGEPLDSRRVYFDSNETITATNTTGFTISGQGNVNMTINTGKETGHFITVSDDFTFWDNNTIRYEGGSNFVDSDTNALANFTLTYIRNDIAEPAASTYKYVTPSGSGTVCSEGSPCSYTYAINNAVGGETWWIKAGTYNITTSINIGNTGTSSNPIKFIGYKTTIDDIISNYYTYTPGSVAPSLSATEMPTIVGDEDENDKGIRNYNVGDYIIVKNLQFVENGIGIGSYYNVGLIVDNCNFDNNTYGGINAYDVDGSSDPAVRGNTYFRVTNCNVINSWEENVTLKGQFNLIDNVNSYCDTSLTEVTESGGPGLDYYYMITGSNNIVKNSTAERQDTSINHRGHGIGVKAGENNGFSESYYNLFKDNYAKGILENYYTRNHLADYNVFKDCESVGFGELSAWEAKGMVFMTDSKNNIAERMYIHDISVAISLQDGTEVHSNADGSGTYICEIRDNIVRNSIIEDAYTQIAITNTYGSNQYSDKGRTIDNLIYNNTFSSGTEFLYKSGDFTISTTDDAITGNDFTNNIFNAVTSIGNAIPSGFVFDHNNYWTSWTSTLGTNPYNLDPSFTGFYIPTNTSLNVGVPTVGAEYDYALEERDDTNPTMGAVETQIVSVAGNPLLWNFRYSNEVITTGQGSSLYRVYFSSTESITGTTVGEVTISGKIITNVYINGNELDGHFYTVTVPFVLGDIHTIAYEGIAEGNESNIADNDGNNLADFEATSIQISNNTLIFASNRATVGGTGTIDDPYDVVTGFENIELWIYFIFKRWYICFKWEYTQNYAWVNGFMVDQQLYQQK